MNNRMEAFLWNYRSISDLVRFDGYELIIYFRIEINLPAVLSFRMKSCSHSKQGIQFLTMAFEDRSWQRVLILSHSCILSGSNSIQALEQFFHLSLSFQLLFYCFILLFNCFVTHAILLHVGFALCFVEYPRTLSVLFIHPFKPWVVGIYRNYGDLMQCYRSCSERNLMRIPSLNKLEKNIYRSWAGYLFISAWHWRN